MDTTFSLVDEDNGEVYIVVRAAGDGVALAVSLERDGDYEVLLSAADALLLSDALRTSAAQAATSTDH